DYVMTQIEQDKLAINDRLPSLNQLMSKLQISKGTALKGLQYLTEKGIIESEYRKGYYVKKLKQVLPYRVCVILDKMNILRDRVYHGLLECIHERAEVDLCSRRH